MIAKNSHLRILKVFTTFLASTLVLLSFLFIGFSYMQTSLTGRFYPNIYIDGHDISRKTTKEAAQLIAPKENKLEEVKLTVLYQDSPIATFSANDLHLRTNTGQVLTQAYLIGRNPEGPTRLYQRFAALFNLERYNFTTLITYDKSAIEKFTSQSKDLYNKPPVDAKFQFDGGRVTTFEPEKKGYQLLDQKFIEDFDKIIQSLKKDPKNQVVRLTGKEVEPKITLSKANQFGIEELIGTGNSNFSHSIPGRIHNVALAASKFNGVLIAPGQVFSFNDIVGDISSLTGYEQAYIIKNGKTVLGDGGGVCQVSTTLFRAALNTGLPIIERTAHAYRVGYYENDSGPGFDATVYGPTVDFKFKNDTSSYILIQEEIDLNNTLLSFKFYGKKDGRIAKVSTPVITNVEPAPPSVNQDDPTLKKGTTKQVDFAAPGARVTFNYAVYKNNVPTFQKTFLSVYRPWAAVYLVGTGD